MINEVEEVDRENRRLIDQWSEFEQLRCRNETQVALNQCESSPSRCATQMCVTSKL